MDPTAKPFFGRRGLLACIGAAIVGFAGTFGVNSLVPHAAAAVKPAVVQYLKSPTTQPWKAPDFSLKDQNGQTVSTTSLRGQVVIITFMDPRCRSLCPINAQLLSVAESHLPPAVTPVLVVVSVAADRTPADVSNFVSHVTWRPGWHWLLGNQAQLQAVWATWSLALDGTDVVHQEIAHVIDRQGMVIASYNVPYQPSSLADTVTSIWSK